MAKKLTTISLARKKELDRPDEVKTFLSRIFEFCVAYRTTFFTALAGVLVLALIVTGYRHHLARSEDRASAALAEIMNRYEETAANRDGREALDAIREDWETFESRFGRTRTAGFARLHPAGFYYDAGDHRMAAETYEKLLAKMKSSHPLYALALIGNAYAREALGDVAAAIRFLEQALSAAHPSMHGDIRFQLGRLHAEQGRTEISMDMYRRIVEEHQDSLYHDMARNLAGM